MGRIISSILTSSATLINAHLLYYTIKTSFKTLVAGFIPYYLSDKLFLVFITDLNYLTFYDSALNHRYTIGIGNANVNRIYPRFASL